PELAKAEDFIRDLPIDGGGGAALIENVRAEAGQPFDAEREVELEIFFEAMLLRVSENGIRELFRLRRRQRRHVQRRELAVDPNLRRGVGSDVQIRAAALDHRFE